MYGLGIPLTGIRATPRCRGARPPNHQTIPWPRVPHGHDRRVGALVPVRRQRRGRCQSDRSSSLCRQESTVPLTGRPCRPHCRCPRQGGVCARLWRQRPALFFFLRKTRKDSEGLGWTRKDYRSTEGGSFEIRARASPSRLFRASAGHEARALPLTRMRMTVTRMRTTRMRLTRMRCPDSSPAAGRPGILGRLGPLRPAG